MKKQIALAMSGVCLTAALVGCGASAPASSDAPAATAAPTRRDYKGDRAQ